MKYLIIWISCLLIASYVCYTYFTKPILLGITKNGVHAYASNYSLQQNINYIEWKGKSIITGLQWECVEFARRYLLITKGVIFKDIKQANKIWDLLTFINIDNYTDVPCMHYSIGTISPRCGDLLVWGVSERDPYGHIAVIIKNTDDKLGTVEIAEQNYGTWDTKYYSRRIGLDTTPNLLGIIRIP